MKVELAKMLAKAEDKLKTARINFEHGQYDDSISRAYYAVFHAISAVLFSKSLAFSSHSQVIGAFNKEFVKVGIFPKEFTEIVQGLFADRQTGDYDVLGGIDREMASVGIENATKVVVAIRSFLEDHA